MLDLLLVIAALQAGLPSNDRCVDAFVLSQGYQAIGVGSGLPDGSSSCSAGANGPDAWYLMIPRTSGIATVWTCLYPGVPLDSVLSVHSGCPGTATNEIACNDDAAVPGSCGPGSSSVQFAATAGQPYWLRLARASGSPVGGSIQVEGVELIPALNDRPENAIDIDAGEHRGLMGLVPTPLVACFGGSMEGSFYRFTASASGAHTVSTCGPYMMAAILTVVDGTASLGCMHDVCMNNQATLSWSAVAGREYTIGVGDLFESPENFRFALEGPPRASSSCTTAPVVPEGVRVIDLGVGAPSGASTCDTAPDSDWFARVVASRDGVLTISTCGTRDYLATGTGPDTRLSLHTGCPADASTQIACSDAAPACGMPAASAYDASIAWPVAAGDTFVVRVTRDPGSSRTLPVLLTISSAWSDDLCAGDGTGAPCPCGNVGLPRRGCDNSQATGGAFLSASGVARVTADSLTLVASGATASATGLYYQGTASIAGGSGVAFGDGLRCAGGATVRLGLRTSVGGASAFGAGDGTGDRVSTAGGVPASGGTRWYQLWHRDAALFCTASTFGLTNAMRVVWSP